MRYRLLFAATLLFGAILSADAAVPRRGGGGGARPQSRPQPAARPQAQRPQQARPPMAPRPSPQPRPTPNIQRPAPAARPNVPAQRPSPAPVTRPNPPQGNRPNAGPINRPSQLPGGTPGNRPNTLPGTINRPGGNQPGFRPGLVPGNRPNNDLPNRPGFGAGNNRPPINTLPTRPGNGARPPVANPPIDRFPNRPGNAGTPGNRPNWSSNWNGNWANNANRPGGVRPNVNVNQNVYNNYAQNRVNSWNRPGNWNRPGYPYHPYYGYHNNWYHGGWNWNRYPSYWGTGAAFATGWLFGASSSFYNPYYVVPSVPASSFYYDYSQPIAAPTYILPEPTTVISQQPFSADVPPAFPVPPVEAPAQPEAPADPKAQQAAAVFDQARADFMRGDYGTALTNVDAGIKILPTDAVLHEFRALTLFAQRKYADATGVIYSVLAVGPGMDWATMKTLYPDPKVYQAQLADLQGYVTANPRDPGSRFLLAYHYLVVDDKPQAVRLLKQVIELNPQDKLAEEMVKALDGK